jgi:hypothetical protein
MIQQLIIAQRDSDACVYLFRTEDDVNIVELVRDSVMKRIETDPEIREQVRTIFEDLVHCDLTWDDVVWTSIFDPSNIEGAELLPQQIDHIETVHAEQDEFLYAADLEEVFTQADAHEGKE